MELFRAPEDSSSARRLPTFLVIGAQRAGTTSLYNYLTAHPGIAAAATKEVHFFDVHYSKGPAWYEAQFPSRGEAQITGEASPYYLFHPLAAARAAAFLPDAKLIVLLRNPVDRALSHHQHETRRGKETLPLAQALALEESRLRGEAERIATEPGYRSTAHQWHSYRARGCYMDQIENWLRSFRSEQLLVLLSEQFYADPSTALRQVTEFIGAEPLAARSAGDFEQFNKAEYGEMPPEVREELVRFYRPHNCRLAEFLGHDPGWDP